MFFEVEDWNKRYVCFETNHLYDLKQVESFYVWDDEIFLRETA